MEHLADIAQRVLSACIDALVITAFVGMVLVIAALVTGVV